MTEESRCIHEMLPGQCGMFRPPRKGKSFESLYEGHCALCNAAIVPGELIRWTDDGTAVQHNRHR